MNRRHSLARNLRGGFSMLEVLITIVVVSVGLLAVGVLHTNVIGSSAQSKIRTEALTIAQRQVEDYRQFLNATSTSWMSFASLPASAAGTFADYTITYASGAASTGEVNISVTVDWSAFAKSGEMSSVEVSSKVAYVNPNAIADSVKTRPKAMVDSPTGRAYLGEGSIDLDTVPAGDKSTNEDGTVEVVQGDDRLLVVPSASGDDNVVLTLENACVSGSCTEFVKISGRIYMDQGMSNPKRTLDEIFVTASDAGYCHMWLPGRASLNLPADAATTNTSSPSYRFVYYTCYLGGGWHGNIGVLYAGGVASGDFACMGDPTASDADDRQTYGVRRAYRGMLASGAEHTSIGIRDATVLSKQDFVISKKSPIVAQTACDGPMTRTDSVNTWMEYSQTASAGVSSPRGHDSVNSGVSGKLFAGVPTDFVCLNEVWYDYDGAGPSAAVRAIDDFEAPLTALSSCPYDPTDPPVTYIIAGEVTYPLTAQASAALSSFVVDIDGDICARGDATTLNFVASGGLYKETYRCMVYSEEGVTNWSVKMNARSYDPGFYCSLPARSNQGSVTYSYSSFSGGYALNSENISCVSATSYNVTGNLALPNGVALTDLSLNVSDRGYCTTSESSGVYSYSCFVYPNGTTWNGSITADIANPAYECNDEVALPKSTTGDVIGGNLTCYYAPTTLSVIIENNAGNGAKIEDVYLTKASSYGGGSISCAVPKNSLTYTCTVPDIGALVGGKVVIDTNKTGKAMQLTAKSTSSITMTPSVNGAKTTGDSSGLHIFTISVSPLPSSQGTYSLNFRYTDS